MNHKKLTFAAIGLALCVITPGQAAIWPTVNVNDPYSATTDAVATPAFWVTGTWDLTDGDSFTIPGPNWSLDLVADVRSIGGYTMYVFSVAGTHLVGNPVPTFGASLGMLNVVGNAGTITSFVGHEGMLGDYWRLDAGFYDSSLIMNFNVRAAHMGENPRVPDAGSTSMLLGCALLGLGLLRRRFF